MTDGIWVARSLDNPTHVLTADTAPELRWLLRTAYGQWLRTGIRVPPAMDTASTLASTSWRHQPLGRRERATAVSRGRMPAGRGPGGAGRGGRTGRPRRRADSRTG
jgi:hypothetical protein